METLEGKVALVTGGGRGLGEAICRTPGRRRGRSSSPAMSALDLAEEVVAGDPREGGGRPSRCSSTSPTRRRSARAIEQIIARHGRLDVAGQQRRRRPDGPGRGAVAGRLGPDPGGQPPRAVPDVEARPAERCAGRARATSSTSSRRPPSAPGPTPSAYHASKWGLLGLSHALHVEARPHGVKVTAVVAGGMRTPFLLDRFPDLDPGRAPGPARTSPRRSGSS